MKKWICLLLCALWLLPASLAEGAELPVLVAQLGAGVTYVGTEENGDEYLEHLEAECGPVYLARYAGQLSAEDVALKICGEVHDGELLVDGEDGIDQRALFYTDGDVAVADVTVISLDGYTYAFVCRMSAAMYEGQDGQEPWREQVNFWVDSLDVFDADEPAALSDMPVLLYDNPFLDSCELVYSDAAEDGSYAMALSAEDGYVVLEERTVAAAISPEDMASRIDPDAAEYSAVQDAALTERMRCPAWLCSWTTGQNEDLRQCRALIVTMDSVTLALRVGVTADVTSDYEQQVMDMLQGAELYAESTVGGGYVLAEEVASCLFTGVEDFWYAGEGEVCGSTADLYEFLGAEGDVLGTVAVGSDTGDCYAAFGDGDDFAPVQWDETEERWYVE